MMGFKTGDHVWVPSSYGKPREAVIMRLNEQDAEVCFILTQTCCVLPLSTLIPVSAFAIMGDNNDNL